MLRARTTVLIVACGLATQEVTVADDDEVGLSAEIVGIGNDITQQYTQKTDIGGISILLADKMISIDTKGGAFNIGIDRETRRRIDALDARLRESRDLSSQAHRSIEHEILALEESISARVRDVHAALTTFAEEQNGLLEEIPGRIVEIINETRKFEAELVLAEILSDTQLRQRYFSTLWIGKSVASAVAPMDGHEPVRQDLGGEYLLRFEKCNRAGLLAFKKYCCRISYLVDENHLIREAYVSEDHAAGFSTFDDPCEGFLQAPAF